MPKVIQLIESYEKRGTGTEEDPVRKVYRLHDFDGKLVHEDYDPDRKHCIGCGIKQ